jgi:hypothetical protein
LLSCVSAYVQDLLGDEGVLQCRSLLDGMEGGSDTYLQQIISEGRCVVCNHSTFEEDMQQQRAAATGGLSNVPRCVKIVWNLTVGRPFLLSCEFALWLSISCCLCCINPRPGVVVAVRAEEEGETKEDEVILCDGCNAEVHLRCLNLTTVSR